MADTITVPRGLAGVVVTDTRIGHVRGLEGFYHYRQYSAIDLAERRTLEDVWALLIDGSLPAEPKALHEEIVPLRHIPPAVAAALPDIATAAVSPDPMGGLRAALAIAGLAAGARPLYDTSPAERRAEAMALCALTPSLLAALFRLRAGLDPIEARDDLSHAANYLYMITGEEPSEAHARSIERYLIATVDHGFNASTFTARVIASTGADIYACIGGALGALSGPLHGGLPAGPSTHSTPSAPSTGRTRGCALESSTASGSWGSGTRSTARKTRGRACSRGSPKPSAGSWWTLPWPLRSGSCHCWRS